MAILGRRQPFKPIINRGGQNQPPVGVAVIESVAIGASAQRYARFFPHSPFIGRPGAPQSVARSVRVSPTVRSAALAYARPFVFRPLIGRLGPPHAVGKLVLVSAVQSVSSRAHSSPFIFKPFIAIIGQPPPIAVSVQVRCAVSAAANAYASPFIFRPYVGLLFKVGPFPKIGNQSVTSVALGAAQNPGLRPVHVLFQHPVYTVPIVGPPVGVLVRTSVATETALRYARRWPAPTIRTLYTFPPPGGPPVSQSVIKSVALGAALNAARHWLPPWIGTRYPFKRITRGRAPVVQWDHDAGNRQKKHERVVADILNSLISQLQIVQTDATTWQLGYSPGNPSRWVPVPTVAWSALDQLAEAVFSLNADVDTASDPSKFILRGPAAARPAAGSPGVLYLDSDGFYVSRDNSAVWESHGPLFPLTPPVLANYIWFNQGTATVSATSGSIILSGPAQASDALRGMVMTAPSTPYTITAMLWPLFDASNFAAAGLCFSDGTAFHNFAMAYDDGGGSPLLNPTGLTLQSTKFTNATTFSAHYRNLVPPFGYGAMPHFMRIADDGANRICSISMDGINFLPFHTVGRTDFLTATKVGFFVNNTNSAVTRLTLLSWLQG